MNMIKVIKRENRLEKVDGVEYAICWFRLYDGTHMSDHEWTQIVFEHSSGDDGYPDDFTESADMAIQRTIERKGKE